MHGKIGEMLDFVYLACQNDFAAASDIRGED
jgi:hypothetical protein